MNKSQSSSFKNLEKNILIKSRSFTKCSDPKRAGPFFYKKPMTNMSHARKRLQVPKFLQFGSNLACAFPVSGKNGRGKKMAGKKKLREKMAKVNNDGSKQWPKNKKEPSLYP